MSAVEPVLAQLAAQAAAPLHEALVSAAVRRSLESTGIPYRLDRFGNIIAHYRAGAPRFGFALVAHMDHPGFEIARGRRKEQQAMVLGGVARSGLIRGAPLRLFTAGGEITGRVAALAPQRRDGRPARFTFTADGLVDDGAWGVWGLSDFEPRGDVLHLRAADDLAGCAITLSALAALAAQAADADVYGVFTRAEEIGLVGASLVARQQIVPKETIVVSLEASRQLPGAELGKGPVIRTGDLRRTFDFEAEQFLHAGRDVLAEQDPPRAVQRQLMYGGACEATPFSAFGYRATGIALPLGNYHNQGENGLLEAEYIHRDDLAGALELVLAVIDRSRRPLSHAYRDLLERRMKTYRARLAETALDAAAGRRNP